MEFCVTVQLGAFRVRVVWMTPGGHEDETIGCHSTRVEVKEYGCQFSSGDFLVEAVHALTKLSELNGG